MLEKESKQIPVKSDTAVGDSSDCSLCAQLLQKVLLHTASSRPRKLLESLNPTAWRPIANGIQVEIASPQTEPTRNWNDAELNENDPRADSPKRLAETFGIPQRRTSQLAFSSKKLHFSDELLKRKEEGDQQSSRKEWLSIVCRECSDTGPEGNARAFITGPSPISVVVCTNRSGVAEMEEMLVHELIHVYDVRKLQLDLRLCENLAYSEVRAAKQAECYGGLFTSSQCVSQKAFTATQNLFPARASQQCVQNVLQTALRDDRPFGNVNKTSGPTKTAGSER
jgi:hypothetical protein